MQQHPEDHIDSSEESTDLSEDEAYKEGYQQQTVETCEKALEYYNSSKGEKYVMVLPLCSSALADRVHGNMYHCNFWAKVGDNADDASATLFFAELYIVEPCWRRTLTYDPDSGKMLEGYAVEPVDESVHGPGAKEGDLNVLSCVKLEGAGVPKYEADIDVSSVYHPDAAQDTDCDCCNVHCEW